MQRFNMKKNFTQRGFDNASNSSFRNAGTYYTNPNIGQSGAVLDAYRKVLP